MFHAPISDSKQQVGSTKADPSMREHDWSPAFDGPHVLGLPQIGGGGLRPPTPFTPRQQRLARLQRVYGNQAVLRMQERSRPAIQPKLVVNEPGDAYEQEADRIAGEVMRMPDSDLSIAAAPPQVSRKCVACEEEAKTLQTKPPGTSEAAAGEAPPIVHEVLRSPGQPLDTEVQTFMEPRFGHDFTKVRVHADAKAAASARAIDAQAYTVGFDLVFAEGRYRYAPTTGRGRLLLAHELAHVVQQSAAPAQANQLQRQDGDDGAPVPQAQPDVEPDQPEELGGRAACPVTAIFLSTVAGPQKAGCLVAQGKFGASKLAEYRVAGAAAGASMTISETFKAVDDPYNAIGLLQPANYTATNGIFDDCYLIESSNPLPADFVLTVEQNHFFNGQIISKNRITYRTNSVSFCHFDRLPGKCDFGARCKL